MLELIHLAKAFPFEGDPSKERRAIQNVDLRLADGDFLVVIGGNGSGKSTLLNLIAGSIKPDEGQVVLNGVTLNRFPERKRAKYI